MGYSTHLYRLAEAHLVAEEYPSVPSLNSSGHALALENGSSASWRVGAGGIDVLA